MRGKRLLQGVSVGVALWILAVAAPVIAAEQASEAAEKGAEEVSAEAESKAAEKAAPEECDRRLLLIDPEWVKKSKQPVPWLKWGADLRLREIWGDNITTLDESTAGHERHFQRYRGRVWASILPHEDISLNARLVWEPRVIQKPKGAQRWIWDEVLFDRLNVTWRNIADLPLTATIGRQDIILGDGWLVLDGTPLDGSRTIYFNAYRLTWEAKEIDTTFDAIYIDNDDEGGRWIKPFNNNHRQIAEQDERGLIFNVANTSLENTRAEGYYIYKKDHARVATAAPLASHDSDMHTIGTRWQHDFNDHWRVRAEGAHQWGEKNNQTLQAFGFNSRATYFCRDDLDTQFRLHYEFLSGDDPDSAAIEGFDLLWARWPRWSELYMPYTHTAETGRPAAVNNLHRVAMGWTCNPNEVMELCADYHLLWSDENNMGTNPRYSDGGTFRGQLLTAWLKYKFNQHVSGHLLTEFFFPGNYYTDAANDAATFLRYELVFSW